MRTDFQSTNFISGGASAREAADVTPRSRADGLAEARPSDFVAATSFDDWLADSATTSEARAPLARSVTENPAWTDRVALNLSPLSESPSSVARAIRESYGRYLSARPRRFHAHA